MLQLATHLRTYRVWDNLRKEYIDSAVVDQIGDIWLVEMSRVGQVLLPVPENALARYEVHISGDGLRDIVDTARSQGFDL